MQSNMTGSATAPLSVSALSQHTFSRLAQLGLMTMAAAAVRMGEHVQTWRLRSESRRYLAMMGERDLRDLGITRHEVHVELRKAFWQA